jgi:hypothetical protein
MGSFGREERAYDAHAEDHQGQQHQDLGSLEDEELNRQGHAAARRHLQEVVGKPFGERFEAPVQQPPPCGADQHESQPGQDPPATGGDVVSRRLRSHLVGFWLHR